MAREQKRCAQISQKGVFYRGVSEGVRFMNKVDGVWGLDYSLSDINLTGSNDKGIHISYIVSPSNKALH